MSSDCDPRLHKYTYRQHGVHLWDVFVCLLLSVLLSFLRISSVLSQPNSPALPSWILHVRLFCLFNLFCIYVTNVCYFKKASVKLDKTERVFMWARLDYEFPLDSWKVQTSSRFKKTSSLMITMIAIKNVHPLSFTTDLSVWFLFLPVSVYRSCLLFLPSVIYILKSL